MKSELGIGMPGSKSKEQIEDDLIVRWWKKIFEDGDCTLYTYSINKCEQMGSKMTHLEEILEVSGSQFLHS